MDTGKDYVAPAIAAEDDLEQTSLACHATEPWPAGPAAVYAAVFVCDIDVSKGGAMDSGCDVVLEDPQEIVVLS